MTFSSQLNLGGNLGGRLLLLLTSIAILASGVTLEIASVIDMMNSTLAIMGVWTIGIALILSLFYKHSVS